MIFFYCELSVNSGFLPVKNEIFFKNKSKKRQISEGSHHFIFHAQLERNL